LHPLLGHTLERIEARDARAGAQLRKFVEGAGPVYAARAQDFFSRFERFLQSQGRSFDYGIECYLKLRETMVWEEMKFLRSGQYSNRSFAEVAERVYRNPDVMEYHLYGLVLAQFLWPDQYHRFSFFCEHFPEYAPDIRRYLEIGGGHGLYAHQAALTLGGRARVDVVDISPSSMELARAMLDGLPVSFYLTDIFDFAPEGVYDFITMGEVLEHLEDPLAMLKRVRELLAPKGHAYITTPANSAMIDHIYLFNNANEIRETLAAGGFRIEKEASMYAKSMPAAQAEALKVALMYAAFVEPR